jgi:hypothetical protein
MDIAGANIVRSEDICRWRTVARGFVSLALISAFSTAEAVLFHDDCVPPPGAYVSEFHQTFSGVPLFELNNGQHFAFDRCDDPATDLGLVSPGDTAVHSFGSRIRLDTTLGTFVDDDVAVTVRLTLTGMVGSTRLFDTEMLQLDISGGTLPVGIMLREDPDRASLGQLTIEELGPGLFKIDSFFDVFTELSIDGGFTFHDSDGPARVVLVSEPGTLLLFAASLLLLTWSTLAARTRVAVNGDDQDIKYLNVTAERATEEGTS